MRKIGTIAVCSLLRLVRERVNLFFMLVLPILIIAVLGAQFGEDDPPEVGVTGGGALTDGVVERLTDTGAVRPRRVDGAAELSDLVQDESLPAGVLVPDDVDARLRAGQQVTVTVLLSSADDAAQLADVIGRAVTAQAMVPGVVGQLDAESGAGSDTVIDVVTRTSAGLPPVELTSEVAGEGEQARPFGFDQMAAGMLLLMTFLNTLTASASLIHSREIGVSRRMVATPTRTGTIVLGETAGRWGIGLLQGLYIMVATLLLFGVQWGHLPTTLVVLGLFAAVGAGAAMLVGALMNNNAQAAGVTTMAGLALGALGGTMLPLELFGSTMRKIAHVTPHAWALDAFTEAGRHGATFTDVLPEIGVLAAYAVALLALAAWRLRITLTRL